jgi:parvulin-like peptidyl-prolyl isomerase
MRRLNPLFVGFLATLTLACTDPPKPAKASEEDLAKIDKGGEGEESSTLGTIPTGPIAKVGDVEIPNEAFTSIYELKVKKYTDRGRDIPTSADRRYRKSIAERLIYHEVLKQEAAALGVTHDEAALKERQAQQKRGIRDWEKHLERRGETEESLTEMYVAELREKAILDKLGKLAVTEEEIDADYEKIKGNWKSDKPRVRASHILIPIGPATDSPRKDAEKPPEMSEEDKTKFEAEAKTKAEEIHKLVAADGANFEEIAKEKSTGPSAAKGGDIGIFTADRMAEEFSEVAFKLEPGQISKPVKTKFGYHIIKVTGKWGPGELPKEALKDQIVNRLEQRKLHQGRRELKEELLAKYEIVDNIKPTLGPEPERKSGAKMEGHDDEGHARPLRDMSKVVDRKARAAAEGADKAGGDNVKIKTPPEGEAKPEGEEPAGEKADDGG